jgi:DNA-binding MarR family transcriptional regulator
MQPAFENVAAALDPQLASMPSAEPVSLLSTDAMFDLLNTLQNVAKAVYDRWDRALRSSIPGMSAARASVLLELARSGDTHQARLARYVGVSAMTVTRMIDDLEEEGWVKRVPAPGDRRTNTVALTDAGFGVLDAIHFNGHAFLRESLAGLDEERGLALIAALALLK